MNSEKIQKIKKETQTKLFDDGHKKGKSEALEDWEKAIKEKFEIDSESKGLDLINDLIAAKSKVKLDDEKIKTSKIYLDLEKSTVPKKKYEEVEKQFNDFRTGVEQEKIRSRVKSDARKLFLSLNPVLPKDPVKSENQVNVFLDLVTQKNWKLQDDGLHIMMNGEGRVEDEHGNPVIFDKYVQQSAKSMFDFKQQDDRGNAGNENDASGGDFSFKSKKEYLDAFVKEEDPKKRVEMMKAYEMNRPT